ncbi:MAG TPA: ABC transporter permease [Casimicrobiaceae bacterium]|nr:ABC transporter permease [Thermoanaerobaculia bacterium]HLX26915.1 ABC transporter permease [Casimicrobiaceae bacterium]
MKHGFGIREATLVRAALLAVLVAVLEIACRTGLIQRFTMIPPSEMVVSLVRLFQNRDVLADAGQTLLSVFIALACALVAGFAMGVALYAFPRARRIADPLLTTYYSVPVFVFYPLLIVLFGLNAIPKTVIGFLYAVVVMAINTLNGLERVPFVYWKTAQVHHLSRMQTALHLILPCAGPYLFTGAKFAIAYAFVGVIGSEFILSTGGLGYRVSFAYNNFQSDVMYGVILFVLVIVVCINMALYAWERVLMERRGGR